MSEIKGDLFAAAPGLVEKEDKELTFAPDTKIGSVEFYDIIKKEIGSLNYLVISLGDEDLSMDTAIKICELAYRYRDWDEAKDAHKNSKKLNIYVRSYCPESLYRLKR